MSSGSGSREIEAARKRLTAARIQASAAKDMLKSAQTLSNTADKEVKDAEQFLSEIEKRLEVIDIDSGDEDVTNESINDSSSGSNVQREVVSPDPDIDMQHKLTSNAISIMYSMTMSSSEDTSFTPLLQVVLIRKLDTDEEQYKVILSDGQHFISSMLAVPLNHMVNDGIISLHCILRITEFFNITSSGEKNCIILNVERVEDSPTRRFGEPVDISKVPINQVEVEGCGVPEFDGKYRKSEVMHQSAPVYSKKGQWKGKETTFAIFMPSFNTYNWYIGTWIGDIDSGVGPGTSFYSSTYDSRDEVPPSCVTPPEKNWEVVGSGGNPAPTCRLIRGGN